MPEKATKATKAAQKATRTRRAPQAKVARVLRPLTRQQKDREHVLIECEITKADIARLLGVSEQAIANIFRDRSRSIGALEPGIVQILNKQRAKIWERDSDTGVADLDITCASMGWPQGLLSPEGESAEWAQASAVPSIAPATLTCLKCEHEQPEGAENCTGCGEPIA